MSAFLWLFGAVVAIAIGWYMGSPTVALAGPVLVGVAYTERRRRFIARRQSEVDQQLPLLIDVMIQHLRAGHGLHGLFLHPPSVGDHVDQMLSSITESLGAGAPLKDAVGRFGGRATESTRLVATALTVVATHGGPVAPALQRLHLTLTSRAQARAEARARSSQALASARILISAPALFAVLLASFDQRLADLYLDEPIGAVCVVGCIVLSYLSWWWMQSLVRRLLLETA